MTSLIQLGPKRKYPVERCLHTFIEGQANHNPSATALIFENTSLSYGQLNKRANNLALLLTERGIGPDKIAGVCAERSIEMVIALLSVLKAGGAYLPLDPSLPKKRLQFMVEESNSRCVLTQAKFQSFFGDDVPLLDLDEPEIAGVESEEKPVCKAGPKNIAYVIYTSGSTGTPKGVMNQHDGIVNRLFWMQEQFKIGPHDVVLQKTPCSFDVSAWEFFWPLMVGARLVVAKPGGHKDPNYLLDLIQREKVTVIHFVPSMLRQFLKARNLDKSNSLRYVICSGETLDFSVQREFFNRCGASLFNLYGPTEAAIDVTYWKCNPGDDKGIVPIGFPISNMALGIFSTDGKLVPPGEIGELCISGVGVSRGYVNRNDLTGQKFVKRDVGNSAWSRWYLTGDLARVRDDGAIYYLGRTDDQVKLRGFRIELGEIQTCLERLDSVHRAVVMVREDTLGNELLVGYIQESAIGAFSGTKAGKYLSESLPEYMIPGRWIMVKDFPLSANGKLDRKRLPSPSCERPDLSQPYVAPVDKTQRSLVQLWEQQLYLEKIGIDDNFFDLGGTSLMALELIAQINQTFGVDLQVVKIFQYPSVSQLAAFLTKTGKLDLPDFYTKVKTRNNNQRDDIAIVGMAGRFPGAETVAEFWENLCNAVESIERFGKNELGPGIDKGLLDDADYIPARGIIKDADKFDAAFFGISPLEAKVMDPQQRVFLQLAWSALENAGYDSSMYRGDIGVFAGVGDNHYYSRNLIGHKDLLRTVGNLSVEYGNQKDYIATRACYALNLTGPGVSVNTGCSTTLLAVDMAVRSLRDGECDMAIAGGADVHVPQKSGFLYQKNGTFAKDGHCRPFDAGATGTMFNDGAGAVVLKRVSDALAERDTIYAVIKETAKNNDGSNKVSFLAPSVEGQSRVIVSAQARSGVNPEDIEYIEAHGTATPIGDPIEIEALTKAFRLQTEKKQFCWIGSLKGNVGHPTIAAGVAGLIKAALCLYHGKIPPTLHFKKPNPQIDFSNSPFKVADTLKDWPRREKSRYAAVSSFGFGGTNTHAILQEAPLPAQSGQSRPAQLFLLSAKNIQSLENLTESIKNRVSSLEENQFADAAFTLQTGRRGMQHRRYVIATDGGDGQTQFSQLHPQRSATKVCTRRNPEIFFLFPGQGSQYVHMGRQLYATEPIFHRALDRCCEILKLYLGRDLRTVIHPDAEDDRSSYEMLKDTLYTQPAIFTVEYSLALLWMSWGITPSMMVGHSIGEFVAACIAGVFSLDDALKLVAARGKLMKGLPRGSMLSLRCSAGDIEGRLPPSVQLAASNGSSLCVVSGPCDAIAAFEKQMTAYGLICRQLHTSHAFHSAMMDPIVPEFTRVVSSVERFTPKLPFISSVTGKPISDKQATEPSYWGRHLRMPVRFSDAAKLLVQSQNTIFLEVGPRTTLTTLSRQYGSTGKEQAFIASLSDNADDNNELIALLSAVGQLWVNGYSIDWRALYQNEIRSKIPLPTYPFEQKRYWVDPAPQTLCSDPANSRNLFTKDEELEHDRSGKEQKSVPASDGIEEQLVRILSETSDIPPENLNTTATFLDLGMDSLFLTQAAFQIGKKFNIKLSFGQLLKDFPNISVLAAHIKTTTVERSQAEISDGEIVGPFITNETLRIPTTFPQRGIWTSSQLGTDQSCAYNESFSLLLNGAADIKLLSKSVESLSREHQALTAHFADRGGVMVLNPTCSPSISVYEVSAADKNKFNSEIREHARQEACTAFNLETGPLFRARILRAEQMTAVIFTGHHIICDGWSLDVIIEALLSNYRDLLEQKSLTKTATYPFPRYVQERAARESTEDFNKQKKYWLHKFSNGIPPLELPPDTPRPSLRSYKAKRIDRVIPQETVRLLRLFGNKNGCSFFSTFLSGLGIFIRAIGNSNEFVIGLPTAEQARINQKKLVGHCVNIIPLLISIDEAESFSSFVGQTQGRLIEAYDNQDYTLIHLLYDLTGGHSRSKAPPVSVGLTGVKRWEVSELPDVGVPVDYWANPKSFESFELYFNVVESIDRTLLTCHYNCTIFHKKRIDDWLDSFLRLLAIIAASPDKALADYIKGIAFPGTQILDTSLPLQDVSGNKDNTSLFQADSSLERNLTAIWLKTLSLKTIDRNVSFFDAGGHSLLAAKLFVEIEKAFGIKAPLSLLYDAPTIAEMTVALNGLSEAKNSWKNIVPIKSTGSKHPFFLIHGAEGNVLLYKDLAKHLPEDIPLFGIQSSGLDGNVAFDPEFKIIAETYIHQIKEVQPSGPYFLGGYCLGGVIALEAAQQLKRMGDEVKYLCMIENYNVQVMKWPMPWYYRRINSWLNLYFHARNLLRARTGSKVIFLKTKTITEWNRFRVLLALKGAVIRERYIKKNKHFFHYGEIAQLYDDALTNYKPQKYSGTIHLFVSDKHFFGFTDPQWGWGGVAENVSLNEIHVFPRGTLVEPYVKILAEKIGTSIEKLG